MDKKTLLHFFNQPTQSSSRPDLFHFPFYHKPDALALLAADHVKSIIHKTTRHDFQKQGKMFGFLVVEYKPGGLGYLMGYSGKLQDDERPQGFVPPIVDVHQKDSFFKLGEQELDVLTEQIETLATRPEFITAKKKYQAALNAHNDVIATSRLEIKNNKSTRKKVRAALNNKENPEQLEALSKLNLESKLEQLAYKKTKRQGSETLLILKEAVMTFEREITVLKKQRAEKSKNIQEEVFKTASFLNFQGKSNNLLALFKNTYEGVPPAGAVECAAPRLLQCCYKLGLKPITFTEFWWGLSPKKQLRKHDTHYAACRGKCEPILNHMLKGIPVQESPLNVSVKEEEIEVLYEDGDLLAVNKPSGLLSVPGKNIKQSVLSVLKKQCKSEALFPVHRLDRQTSGVLLLAKNKKALSNLQMQFEKRSTKKRYIAILDGVLTKESGSISLPLATDYNDRPRQLICFEKGKEAITDFKLLSVKNSLSRVAFFPKTGRSHQLRVHAAFHQGLNMAILGDDLYGTQKERLFLHAEHLVFLQPSSLKEIRLECLAPF